MLELLMQIKYMDKIRQTYERETLKCMESRTVAVTRNLCGYLWRSFNDFKNNVS